MFVFGTPKHSSGLGSAGLDYAVQSGMGAQQYYQNIVDYINKNQPNSTQLAAEMAAYGVSPDDIAIAWNKAYPSSGVTVAEVAKATGIASENASQAVTQTAQPSTPQTTQSYAFELPSNWSSFSAAQKIDYFNSRSIDASTLIKAGVPNSDIEWMIEHGYTGDSAATAAASAVAAAATAATVAAASQAAAQAKAAATADQAKQAIATAQAAAAKAAQAQAAAKTDAQVSAAAQAAQAAAAALSAATSAAAKLSKTTATTSTTAGGGFDMTKVAPLVLAAAAAYFLG